MASLRNRRLTSGTKACRTFAAGSARYQPTYVFFAAFNFAHLARAAAAILFLPAAEIVRLGFRRRSMRFSDRQADLRYPLSLSVVSLFAFSRAS